MTRWLFLTLIFLLSNSAINALADKTVREYWIVAEEVDWNFAPSYPTNIMTGQSFSKTQNLFVKEFKGRKYRKAVFRAYTKFFQKPIPRSPEDKHLGILGPIIRAAVGERISVHLKNNTSIPISLHPHGVFYLKQYEGAGYNDGTRARQKHDDRIKPGDSYTYVWEVPDRAGPGPADGSSIAWPYHSHVNSPGDINAGLVGAIIITKADMATDGARPKDVDREFVTLFNIFDETESSLAALNLSAFSKQFDNDDFIESNLMHAMNGYVWGNNEGYVMKVGERVRWYVIALGTEADLHTAHWHGVTLLENGRRVDVSDLLPATAKTLDLIPDSPGIWMFHCHVNDHIKAGMMTRFQILASD